MGIAKRPKLAISYTGPRAGERDQVSFDARCSVGSGAEFDVAVLDLDAHGCRIRGIVAAVTKNERVALTFGSAGPFIGRLRWLKHGSAGLAFDVPLNDAALTAARACEAVASGPRVVALRRPQSATD